VSSLIFGLFGSQLLLVSLVKPTITPVIYNALYLHVGTDTHETPGTQIENSGYK
jgi:hypothetical protein